jgi:Spy/CpxP family protein refolding chaperone
MFRRSVAPVAVAFSTLCLAVGVIAQEKKTEKKAPGHEKLQPYWNTLDLTEEQRDSYDKVVRKYRPKLEELEEQIEKLKDQRRKEWRAILTPTQTRKLEAALAAKGKSMKDADDDEPKSSAKRKPKAAEDDADDKDAKKPTKKSAKTTSKSTEKDADDKGSDKDSDEKKSTKKTTTKKTAKKPADDK